MEASVLHLEDKTTTSVSLMRKSKSQQMRQSIIRTTNEK